MPETVLSRPLNLVYLASVSFYSELRKSVDKRNYDRFYSM